MSPRTPEPRWWKRLDRWDNFCPVLGISYRRLHEMRKRKAKDNERGARGGIRVKDGKGKPIRKRPSVDA